MNTANIGGGYHQTKETILGKHVYLLDSVPFNEHSGFVHKRLSSGPTFSAGTSCAYSCRYCYVESMVRKQAGVRNILAHGGGRSFNQVVIRRSQPVQRLVHALTKRTKMNGGGTPVAKLLSAEHIKRWGLVDEWSVDGLSTKYAGKKYEGKVVFGSPLVDVAATPALAAETVDLCEVFLRLTSWSLRLLSKSPHLADIIAVELDKRLPEEARKRVIYGLSTGTLDDEIAASIEPVPATSKRIKALHWLQDNGFRTYGMLCPILPQADPVAYAKAAMASIRAERCEDIWAEPVNFRAGSKAEEKDDEDAVLQHNSFAATLEGLAKKSKPAAVRFEKVALDGDAWEQYCRQTFEALLAAAPKRRDGTTRLIWMQYPRNFDSVPYWLKQKGNGALALGAIVSLNLSSASVLKKGNIRTLTLVQQLTANIDPAVKHLWTKLPKKVQNFLDATRGAKIVTDVLTRTVLSGMNAIIRQPMKMPEGKQCSVFDAGAFAVAQTFPADILHLADLVRSTIAMVTLADLTIAG